VLRNGRESVFDRPHKKKADPVLPRSAVIRCTDSSADGNAHADGRLTFLAIGQVGPPMQSSTTTTLRVETPILPLAG